MAFHVIERQSSYDNYGFRSGEKQRYKLSTSSRHTQLLPVPDLISKSENSGSNDHHPIRQRTGPPSLEGLVVKLTSKFESYSTRRARRRAIYNQAYFTPLASAQARWTIFDIRLVEPKALVSGNERFKATLYDVIVLRVLTYEEIEHYILKTQEIRQEEKRRGLLTVSEAAIPEAAVSEAAIPKIAIPEATTPKIAIPEIPKISIPKAAISEIAIPEATIPKIAVPETAVPQVAIPEASTSSKGESLRQRYQNIEAEQGDRQNSRRDDTIESAASAMNDDIAAGAETKLPEAGQGYSDLVKARTAEMKWQSNAVSNRAVVIATNFTGIPFPLSFVSLVLNIIMLGLRSQASQPSFKHLWSVMPSYFFGALTVPTLISIYTKYGWAVAESSNAERLTSYIRQEGRSYAIKVERAVLTIFSLEVTLANFSWLCIDIAFWAHVETYYAQAAWSLLGLCFCLAPSLAFWSSLPEIEAFSLEKLHNAFFKPTWNWAKWQLLISAWKGKPASPWQKRIHNHCRCGHAFYDDFTELRPEATNDYSASLYLRCTEYHTKLLHSKEVNADTGRASSQSAKPASFIFSGLKGLMYLGKGLLGKDNNGPTLPQRQLEIRGNETQGSSTQTNERLFLLLCIPQHQYATKLLQPQVSDIRSDRDFFLLLRKNYQQMRGRMKALLSLHVLRSIKFVQLEMYKSELVDIRKQNDLPPEDKKDEYRYNPVPAEIIPPVGENHMLHLINHPTHAEEDGFVLDRIPKKMKERLLICPSRGTGLGWGIYFIEGWHISVITLVAFALLLVGSLSFLICWSALKHDVQGASGVAAYIVALLGLAVGSLQAVFELT